MTCPCLEFQAAQPSAAEIRAAYFARRREAWISRALHDIRAGRSWPIGDPHGFKTLEARKAFEKDCAEQVRAACGESAVDELRKRVKEMQFQAEESVDA